MRWLAVGGLALVALLYYRPLRSYVHVRHEVADRTAEVRALRAQKHALERRIAHAATDTALVHEARRLGLVRPTERLFIVRGISAWRRARSTIRGGG